VEGTVLPAAPAAADPAAAATSATATAATAAPAAAPAAKAAAEAAAEASVEAEAEEVTVAEAAATPSTTEGLCLVSYYERSCCKQCYYCCNSYNTYSYCFCICYHMYFLLDQYQYLLQNQP
jgi:hypothetical protein